VHIGNAQESHVRDASALKRHGENCIARSLHITDGGSYRECLWTIAELHAQSAIKQATGEAESTRLRALGEADAIRATGNAKAEAYRAGVEALGGSNYTVMQLTQILAEKNVRIVPDVSVTGAQGANGLLDSMLALVAREKTEKRVA